MMSTTPRLKPRGFSSTKIMKINIEFDTDNSSFDDDFLMEVTRVSRSIKEAIIDSENTTNIRRPLKDVNGNRIGIISIMEN